MGSIWKFQPQVLIVAPGYVALVKAWRPTASVLDFIGYQNQSYSYTTRHPPLGADGERSIPL